MFDGYCKVSEHRQVPTSIKIDLFRINDRVPRYAIGHAESAVSMAVSVHVLCVEAEMVQIVERIELQAVLSH